MEIEASYTDWISKKETSETDKNERKQKYEEFLHKQKQLISSGAAAESDRLYYEKKRQELRTKRSVFTSARTLDQSIVHTQKYGDGIRSRLQQARRERRENITERSTLVERMAELQATMTSLKTWLQEYAADATLSNDLPSIREAHVGLLEAQRNYTREKSAVEDAEKHIFDLEQQILQAKDQQTKIEKEVTTLDVEIKRIQEKIETLLGGVTKRGYQSELEHLLDKELLLATIASLETHRAALEDGKACPLCGALEHPYAKGNLPQASVVKQRITEVRTILEKLEGLTEEQDQIRDSQRKSKSNLVEKQTWLVSLQEQQERGQKGLTKAKTLLTQSDENQSSAQSTMVNLLEKYSQDPINIENSVELLQALGKRERLWLKNQQELEKNKNEIKNLKADSSRLGKNIEHQTHSIFTLHADLVENRSLVEKSYRKRLSLLKDVNVDEAEQALEASVLEAEEKEKQAAKKVAEEAQQVEVLVNAVKSLDKRIAHNTQVQKDAEELFQAGLKAQDFTDQEAFVAARLSLAQRTEIQQTIKDYEERTARITERFETAKSHLEELQVLHQEGWTEAQLQVEVEFFESQSLYYNQRIGALREQLEADKKRSEQHKAQLAKIAQQRKICNLWNRLNTLIGSHDGKKFRNFAQGLTFELLLAHANEHLKALSDRYLLAPDPVQALEVAVLDLYQAGELRSARNLSGGESFLVSLALSLGLSTIASKNVQVDSLFLDEGFGTLDEETLEMALSALVTLHNQGKLVGIISHVGALQERIPTQISVTPVAGGMSQIVGPGCSQLA